MRLKDREDTYKKATIIPPINTIIRARPSHLDTYPQTRRPSTRANIIKIRLKGRGLIVFKNIRLVIT